MLNLVVQTKNLSMSIIDTISLQYSQTVFRLLPSRSVAYRYLFTVHLSSHKLFLLGGASYTSCKTHYKLNTRTRSHWLAEDEQCRRRPSRNYVPRNYVRRTLIPPQREARSSLIGGEEVTYIAFLPKSFRDSFDAYPRIRIVVTTN